MRKIIAAINITIDGFCDHTLAIADEELHRHYNELLKNAGAIIFGRVTYQLMESSWPPIVRNPTGDKPTDEFAVLIDDIPKIVFSRTLTDTGWKNARLAKKDIQEEVVDLRKQPGKDIVVGSPSLIAAFTKLNLFDEYQLCVHPVIAGKGLPLFKNINDKVVLKLLRTKTFGSGAMVLYYEPVKK
jgi:dihydrofolate reductase